MKSVLVTGGTGSFGQAFCKRLLRKRGKNAHYSRIIVFSRGELKQFQMSQELKDPNKRMRYFIGCVRDRDRLRRAMQDVDVVVHAAALKRIETGNYNPVEMVKTNVGGAINVIEAAQDAGVKKVVALSTDKAWQPVSPYGTSKAMAESLFLAANNTAGEKGPRFAVCRYGNIWKSNGSVVPVWQEILKKFSTVPVTDPGCTRFFMTMDEAVDLVLNTIRTMKGGEISIPELPAYLLRDLADAMGAKVDIKGLPSWEKKHEGMAAGITSDDARRMSLTELRDAL